jgi:hypothetical protein
MKRTVKTPMAIPINTSSVRIAPGPARGRTPCECRKIEWVPARQLVYWCTAPARANPKRVIVDLRKTLRPADRRPTADKISRRNLTAHHKAPVKAAARERPPLSRAGVPQKAQLHLSPLLPQPILDEIPGPELPQGIRTIQKDGRGLRATLSAKEPQTSWWSTNSWVGGRGCISSISQARF